MHPIEEIASRIERAQSLLQEGKREDALAEALDLHAFMRAQGDDDVMVSARMPAVERFIESLRAGVG